MRDKPSKDHFRRQLKGAPGGKRSFLPSIASILTSLILILTITPPSQSNAAFQPQLLRYPYLTDLVGSSATVNFATDTSQSMASVKWGQIGVDATCTAHSAPASSSPFQIVPFTSPTPVPEFQWKAVLSLQAGLQYCYRVFLGNAPETDLLGSDPSPSFWTQTPVGSKQPFSFIVFGDWGEVDANGANPDQAALMSLMADPSLNQNSHFAISVGDNVYTTSGFSNGNNQTQYGDLVQIGPGRSGVFGPNFWKQPGASLGFFPAIGNHGFASADTIHPHILNFPEDQAVALSAGRYTTDLYSGLNGITPSTYPSLWYAFDAGIARFYVLEAAWPNNNVGSADLYKNDFDYHWAPGQAEVEWLKSDLAAHPGGVKFAFLHFPLYSDNNSETSDTWLQGANSLEGLLASSGVQIAFSGHAHIYERNAAVTSQLVTYVSGGGGAKLETIGPACSPFDQYGIGWFNGAGTSCGGAVIPTDIRQVHHFLVVSVNGASVTVNPVNELGQSFDSQTYDFTAIAGSSSPSAPTGLRATLLTPTSASLTWGPAADNQGVRGYTLYRNGAALASVDGHTLTYVDTGLSANTNYSYSVDAFNAWGNRSPKTQLVTVGNGISQLNGIYIPLIMN